MPLSFEQVASDIYELLLKSQRPIITIPWQDAYKLSETKRWADARTEGIKDAAWEEYGILVTSGAVGLFVMKDEVFAPLS